MAPRTIILAALVGLAMCSTVSATISISWSDCGTSANHAKISKVTWDPPSPTPGVNVTITATGTIDETVTDMPATLLFAGIIPAKFDMCKGKVIEAPFNLATIYFPPAKCPLSAGTFTSERYVEVASSLPKGKTTTKLTSTDQNGEPVVCIDVTLQNS